MTTECIMARYCRNSLKVAGERLAKCDLCRLSPDGTPGMVHYWRPNSLAKAAKKTKHPTLIDEHRLIKALAHMYDLRAKYGVDKKRRKVLRKAAIAEKVTEKRIIKATQNSGRRNKDGDHLQAGMITLDTKLQTTRENPVIRLAELEKVRKDATRAGSLVGGLIIRNKNNVGVVVLKEEDYAELTRRLLYPEERQ